ncbi:3-oxoacyl-[acyl-carrier-protein] reductase FabG [compost metagenome]
MVSNDGGSIIFFSSLMAELGEAGKIGYCATKSALLGVVRSSALELLKRNIRVNAIAPAIVNTPLTTKLFSGLSDENITEIEKMHPMGFGETSDVVPMIKFLLSDQSRWITGQNIKIDGGYSIK